VRALSPMNWYQEEVAEVGHIAVLKCSIKSLDDDRR